MVYNVLVSKIVAPKTSGLFSAGFFCCDMNWDTKEKAFTYSLEERIAAMHQRNLDKWRTDKTEYMNRGEHPCRGKCNKWTKTESGYCTKCQKEIMCPKVEQLEEELSPLGKEI